MATTSTRRARSRASVTNLSDKDSVVNDKLHGSVTEPFADRLRRRIEAGHTVGEVARAAGLDPSLVSRFSAKDPRSRRPPSFEHVVALARALRTTAADLLEGTDAIALLESSVPRAALDAEVAFRLEVQRTADDLRLRLARAQGELAIVRRQHADAEQRADAEAARARRAEVKVGELTHLNDQAERDRADLREQLGAAQRSWADVQARLRQYEQQIAAARSAASAGTGALLFTALLGGVVGHALGSSRRDEE